MLSKKQQAVFWSVWARAEREVLPATATRFEREALRHKTIKDACSVESLKDVNPGADFDRLMMAVATMANDFDSMQHFCTAGERRTCHMIEACARQIGEIVGQPKGWDYCVLIFDQARLPKSWLDIPDALLVSVFRMLDTHRRRLLRRDHGWAGAHKDQPLGFNPSRTYVRLGISLGYRDGPDERIAVTA